MVDFGIQSWEEKEGNQDQKSGQDRNNDVPEVVWHRLKPGRNKLRIVSPRAKFFVAKYKGSKAKSQWGDRVYTAYPGVEKEECPAVQAGLKPQKRYFAFVINRDEEDPEKAVQLMDMNTILEGQIEGAIDEGKESYDNADLLATDCDLSIKYNPDAPTPGQMYQVFPRPPAPLSDSDITLIEAFGNEEVKGKQAMIKVLESKTTPPSPESVTKRLESLGYEGEKIEEKVEEKNSELEQPSAEKFKFDQPAAS